MKYPSEWSVDVSVMVFVLGVLGLSISYVSQEARVDGLDRANKAVMTAVDSEQMEEALVVVLKKFSDARVKRGVQQNFQKSIDDIRDVLAQGGEIPTLKEAYKHAAISEPSAIKHLDQNRREAVLFLLSTLAFVVGGVWVLHEHFKWMVWGTAR